MDSLHHLQDVIPTSVGFNSRNWLADNEDSFVVRLGAGPDPNDVHSGLSTDLLFADSGGRTGYVQRTQAQSQRIDEAEARVQAAKDAGQAPDPADLEILRAADKESVLSEAALANIDIEVPTDPGQFVWLNPWKAIPGVPRDQAKTAKLKIDLFAIFGRKGIDPRVDGLLVCEAYMLNVTPESGPGLAADVSDGVLIDRIRIDRKRADRGGFEEELFLQPFMNRDIMYDYMMSFVRQQDDRNRTLALRFLAPDEQTFEWKSIYNAYFGVDYRFVSTQLETSYHSRSYMKLDVEQSPEEARESSKARNRQVQGTLLANRHVAIFTIAPLREVRVFSLKAPSVALAEERAQWLYGDKTKIYGGLKRERDPEQDADLQDAIRQSLEDAKGAQSGAGSSNSS